MPTAIYGKAFCLRDALVSAVEAPLRMQQDKHSANDRTYEATSISEKKFGICNLGVGRRTLVASPRADHKRTGGERGSVFRFFP
jgi:hypothetical protein